MQSAWPIVIGVVGVAAVLGIIFLFYSRHQAETHMPQKGMLVGSPTSYKNTATYDFSWSDDFRSMRVVVHRDARIT